MRRFYLGKLRFWSVPVEYHNVYGQMTGDEWNKIHKTHAHPSACTQKGATKFSFLQMFSKMYSDRNYFADVTSFDMIWFHEWDLHLLTTLEDMPQSRRPEQAAVSLTFTLCMTGLAMLQMQLILYAQKRRCWWTGLLTLQHGASHQADADSGGETKQHKQVSTESQLWGKLLQLHHVLQQRGWLPQSVCSPRAGEQLQCCNPWEGPSISDK